MLRALRPWLIVLPLACAGVLAGHETAYAITRTPHEEVHGYLVHLPQVVLLVTLLALLGAACVERGTRLALWPFPAVVLGGFVLQEHLERAAHGSTPFLLDEPVFVVGLLFQGVVALVAWLLARLLVSVVGRRAGEVVPGARRVPRTELPVLALVSGRFAPGSPRLRAPPLDR
jgi:hypothetical protein